MIPLNEFKQLDFRKKVLLIAFLSGFVTVGNGAFGSHLLQDLLTPKLYETWKTAILYQMFHTLVLLILPALRKLPEIPVYFFIAGIFLFSGSLYVYCLFGVQIAVYFTPIGGLCFLAGWAGMFYSFYNE